MVPVSGLLEFRDTLAARGDQGADGTGGANRDGRLQLRLLAGSHSQDAHELQARNVVEDELIERITSAGGGTADFGAEGPSALFSRP